MKKTSEGGFQKCGVCVGVPTDPRLHELHDDVQLSVIVGEALVVVDDVGVFEPAQDFNLGRHSTHRRRHLLGRGPESVVRVVHGFTTRSLNLRPYGFTGFTVAYIRAQLCQILVVRGV